MGLYDSIVQGWFDAKAVPNGPVGHPNNYLIGVFMLQLFLSLFVVQMYIQNRPFTLQNDRWPY